MKHCYNHKYYYFILLFIIGVAFYVWNVYTPEYEDDFMYKFDEQHTTDNPYHLVQNISDIVRCQVKFYFNGVGRNPAHFLIQLFTGILGKSIFNVFNAIIFCLFLHYTVVLIWAKSSEQKLLTVTFSTVLLLPVFRETFLWMTGAINYLWTATVVILFLVIRKKLLNTPLRYSHWVWLPVGVLLGWSHEGLSFPLAIAIVILSVMTWKEKYNKADIPISIGFIIGALICVLSPGTLSRAGGTDTIPFTQKIVRRIVDGVFLLFSMKSFGFLILTTIAWSIRKRLKNRINRKKDDYLILLISVFLSLGIVLFSGFTSARTCFGCELYSMILFLWLIPLKWIQSRYTYLLTFPLLIGYIFILPYLKENSNDYKQQLLQIEQGDDFVISRNEVSIPEILSEYVIPPFCYPKGGCCNPSFGECVYIAKTYSRDSLCFLSNSIVNRMREHQYNERFEIPTKDNYYVCCLNGDGLIKRVKYVLNPSPMAQLPVFNRMERFTLDALDVQNYTILNYQNRRYLIVQKNPMINDRVLDIVYE